MNTAPLLSQLLRVQAALQAGQPLKPHRAALDRDGMLTLSTPDGPVYLWRKRLDATVRNLQARHAPAQAPAPAPKAEPPANALQAFLDAIAHGAERARGERITIRTAAGTARALNHPETVQVLQRDARTVFDPRPLSMRSPVRTAPPKRAVGNFSTADDRDRTLEALRHNLRTAMASGHEPLIKVMRAALDVAEARRVDPRP